MKSYQLCESISQGIPVLPAYTLFIDPPGYYSVTVSQTDVTAH